MGKKTTIPFKSFSARIAYPDRTPFIFGTVEIERALSHDRQFVREALIGLWDSVFPGPMPEDFVVEGGCCIFVPDPEGANA